MSKKLMLIIVGVVIAGGLAAFLVTNNKDRTKSNAQNNTSQSSEKNEQKKINGNLSSISGSGEAQECTYSSTSSGETAAGVMYSDGRGRGLMELDLVSDKGNIGKSHTLFNFEKVYSWTETGGQTFGLVFDKAQLESANNSAATTGQNSASSTKQNFDMDCKRWTVDEAKLTVPSGVNFQSFPQPSL